jgi:dihydrofolate reductase
MTASYTWDVFTTLDGYGSYEGEPDWGGYWSKQGPELLEHRAALYATQQRMVLGATTFREMAQIWSSDIDPNLLDVWNQRLRLMPMTVVSSTLHDTLGWPDATIASGDAVEIISALKRESDLPLRSPGGSITLNRALLAAGLVDRLEVTLFPVISGGNGISPILRSTANFDLELLDSKTLDGNTQALVYRPTLR